MGKICPTCRTEKSLDEFTTDKKTPDGRYFQCRECTNRKRRERYVSDPEYRERKKARARRRYKDNPDVRRKKKEYVEEYRSDPDNLKAYKEYNAWYNRTEKGKEVQCVSHKKYKRKYPRRIRAKTAVNNAIQRGRLAPISTQKCTRCGAQAEHYHHGNYDPEHWLDVEPLCIMCHRALHKEMDQSS